MYHLFSNINSLRNIVYLMRTPFTGQPSEGGIFMKYSYEYKRQCVTLYRQGSWPLTPKGVQPQHFRDMIRRWANSVSCENICRVFYPSLACQAGINTGMLYTWVRKYKTLGYTGLIPKQKGRPAKHTAMKKRIALREQKQAAQDVVALRNTEVVKTIQDINRKQNGCHQ